jgi:hypothetical protein
MMDFFRGWRRKIGLLTLMMALVGMGLWLRSLIIVDGVQFPVGQYDNWIQSEFGFLHWTAFRTAPYRRRQASYYSKGLRIEVQSGKPVFPVLTKETFPSQLHIFGFHFCSGNEATRCYIPYWFIVIALIVLSVFLLLTKPRQLTQKKPPEPTANLGI